MTQAYKDQLFLPSPLSLSRCSFTSCQRCLLTLFSSSSSSSSSNGFTFSIFALPPAGVPPLLLLFSRHLSVKLLSFLPLGLFSLSIHPSILPRHLNSLSLLSIPLFFLPLPPPPSLPPLDKVTPAVKGSNPPLYHRVKKKERKKRHDILSLVDTALIFPYVSLSSSHFLSLSLSFLALTFSSMSLAHSQSMSLPLSFRLYLYLSVFHAARWLA